MNFKLYSVIIISLILASTISAQSLCKGKDCGDYNPCTVDACDESTGECVNLNVPDGYSCGEEKECKNSECITSAVEEIPEESPPTGFFSLESEIFFIGLSVVIIIVVAYSALKK